MDAPSAHAPAWGTRIGLLTACGTRGGALEVHHDVHGFARLHADLDMARFQHVSPIRVGRPVGRAAHQRDDEVDRIRQVRAHLGVPQAIARVGARALATKVVCDLLCLRQVDLEAVVGDALWR
eukprot:2443224-Prymnesium_polylepis.1